MTLYEVLLWQVTFMTDGYCFSKSAMICIYKSKMGNMVANKYIDLSEHIISMLFLYSHLLSITPLPCAFATDILHREYTVALVLKFWHTI